MTVAELAKQAGLSAGMLSKVENGRTSPSLATLHALSAALNVPMTTFFLRFEEQRTATHVHAGQGLKIERRGTRSGHAYRLLGHSFSKSVTMEPYIVTLTEPSEVFPPFPTRRNRTHLHAGRRDGLPPRRRRLPLGHR